MMSSTFRSISSTVQLGLGAHRRGAGIKVHARHFAEQIPGTKVSEPAVVWQIDRSIRGDIFLVRLIRRLCVAGSLHDGFQFAEKPFCPFVPHVRQGRGEINFCLSLKNVESRRTVVPFLADYLPRFISAFADSIAIQIQRMCRTPRRRRSASAIRDSMIGSPWPRSVSTTFLFVSAPVGQETIHSPQLTQLDVPIGKLSSKAIPA